MWLQAATAHLEIGDQDGFRRVCQTLRDRHPAAISDVFVASSLASVLVLGPGGVGNDGKGLSWVEPLPAAVDASQKALKREFLRVQGAVLFRAGRYREAIARVNEAIALGEGQVLPEEALFLALAHLQTGDAAKARAYCHDLGAPTPMAPRPRSGGPPAAADCSIARPRG